MAIAVLQTLILWWCLHIPHNYFQVEILTQASTSNKMQKFLFLLCQYLFFKINKWKKSRKHHQLLHKSPQKPQALEYFGIQSLCLEQLEGNI